MKKLVILTLFAAILIPATAWSLDLQEARSQGIVTEQADGYLAVAKASPEASRLVEEVNSARKQEYERISKQNGQSVDVVAKLAAAQIKQKLGQ